MTLLTLRYLDNLALKNRSARAVKLSLRLLAQFWVPCFTPSHPLEVLSVPLCHPNKILFSCLPSNSKITFLVFMFNFLSPCFHCQFFVSLLVPLPVTRNQSIMCTGASQIIIILWKSFMVRRRWKNTWVKSADKLKMTTKATWVSNTSVTVIGGKEAKTKYWMVKFLS